MHMEFFMQLFSQHVHGILLCWINRYDRKRIHRTESWESLGSIQLNKSAPCRTLKNLNMLVQLNMQFSKKGAKSPASSKLL